MVIFFLNLAWVCDFLLEYLVISEKLKNVKLILIKYKFTICKTNARPLNRIEITIEMFFLLIMQASKH